MSSYLTIKAILIMGTLIVAAAGAVGNAIWGPRARARRRLDAGTKTTIADREIVTLTGTVRGIGELLEAPLSGKRGVLYLAVGRIYELGGARNRSILVAEVVEQKVNAFELETAEGVVRVEGEPIDIELPPLPCIPRRIEREREFLLAHGHSAAQIRGAGFDELVVEPGTKVTVQGMAIVEANPADATERGFRDGAPTKIRIVPHADHPLTIGRARR